MLVKIESYKSCLSGSEKGWFKKGEHHSIKTEFKKGQFNGEKHPFWKGGRYKLKNGYIWCYAPHHPRAYRNGVYEHILIAEKKLKRFLLPGEVVHHINKIKNDNREENITIFSSNGEHMHIHTIGKWSKNFDRCQHCKTQKIKHEAKGLCQNCYKKYRYHKKNENNLSFDSFNN